MKKAIFCFVLTVGCWVLAVVMAVSFVRTIQEQANSSLAVVEAPGSAFFAVEEAGTVSLWHNYKDFRNGKVVDHDPQLPSGYRFEFKEMGSSTGVPLTPSKMNTNFSTPMVSKSGLGMFTVSTPGDYELTVTAPPGQDRTISISQASPTLGFGKLLGKIGGAIVLGFVGVVTLILGIIFIIAKPKSPPSIPSHAS